MVSFHPLPNNSKHQVPLPRLQEKNTNLKGTRILIKRPIVIQNVNKLQPIPLPALEIIRIVSGSYFYSSRSELHVYEDGI